MSDIQDSVDAQRDDTGGRRSQGWRWGRVLAGAGLALALLAGWAVFEGWRAAQAAREAQAHVEAAQDALGSADLQTARDRAAQAAEQLDRARSSIEAVPLQAAGVLPVIGDDVRAIRALTGALDDAVTGAVLPLADAAVALQQAQEQAPDGTVALEPLRETAAVAASASDVTARSAETADAVDATDLIAALRTRVEPATEAVRSLDAQIASLDRALRVAVPVLGGDGPRTYLLAAQNLAEARPTGGLIGSWALLRAEDGAITLEDVGVNDDLELLVVDSPDLPADVLELYGDDLALSPNVNLSPDFPIAARLLTTLWSQQDRPAPDGVIGLDPVALATLLAGVGPVQPPVGPELSADTLVDVVQAQAYDTFDGNDTARQAYLGLVMQTVFAEVMGADLTSPQVRDALSASVDSGHLMMWAADPGLQSSLVDLGISGELPAPDASQVRAYITNADASKLDHYLQLGLSTRCDAGAPVVVEQLTSSVPAQVPDYVRSHVRGLEATTHRVILALYVPPGRGVDSVTVDGRSAPLTAGTERGWSVARTTVDVPRESSVEVAWTLSGSSEPPSVVTQPMTRAPSIEAPAGSCVVS